MDPNHQPPIFVPDQFRAEIEKLSKAALMDIAWNLAVQCSGEDCPRTTTIATFRTERDVTLGYRKAAAKGK